MISEQNPEWSVATLAQSGLYSWQPKNRNQKPETSFPLSLPPGEIAVFSINF